MPRTSFDYTHTTDCTGVFEVMAEQVRPGLTNPARFKGPQQSADLIRRQPAHSIRARGQAPFTEAECMAAISTCFDQSGKRHLATGGRPCMNLRSLSPLRQNSHLIEAGAFELDRLSRVRKSHCSRACNIRICANPSLPSLVRGARKCLKSSPAAARPARAVEKHSETSKDAEGQLERQLRTT